jgi:hypothetical protein
LVASFWDGILTFGKAGRSDVVTAGAILRYARYLEEIEPELLTTIIRLETGEDYRKRDLLDKVTRLIEIFGLEGARLIVGCPL